ncbi:MAG: homoserine dehydrogenase [Pseudomonadota bacterium]|mgnify:FL=1|jgi:homoserine dehydrogenase|nr:homoserine dehydrogenase [Pseudomonadota bacterium]|tara:strand:- start:1292 stop:2590 length:1299 start_codon:yes stop_codon:yes gene_type:complete
MARTINIAIAGLGTVGAETYRIITEESDFLKARSSANFNVVAVSAKSKDKKRDVDLTGVEWIADCRDIADIDNIDVVIELVGGSEGVAKDLVEKAITNGKSVITANKALVATHGNNIGELVAKHDVMFGYEAAVAGGIPIIKTIREGLASNRLSKIYGILNGTCNYILSVMRETGQEFEDILADAQRLGYAEADPSFDVDGVDAAHKLAILSAIAFQTPINFSGVYVEGIRLISPIDIDFATELGYRIKLLGIGELLGNGLQQRVRPCLVPVNIPIAQVEDVFNAVAAEAEGLGTSLSYGRGAGAGPTSSAVLSDLLDFANNRRTSFLGTADSELVVRPIQELQKLSGSYYLRLQVYDRPGVLADLTAVFRDKGVSVEALLQRGRNPDGTVPVVLTTHETSEEAIQKSVAEFEKLENVVEKPCILPIENFAG